VKRVSLLCQNHGEKGNVMPVLEKALNRLKKEPVKKRKREKLLGQ